MAGLISNRYKLFVTGKIENNKIEVHKDVKLKDLYDHDLGINLFAVESLGKPSKWKRFSTHYEGSEWSCSGSSDGIVFVPQKDILMSGFASWAPKTDPKYLLKYKVEVDNKVVAEDKKETEYNKFEETYYNKIIFENPIEVKANQKIKLTTWISKNFANSEYVYTYYGSNGSEYAAVQNEHMGLFELEASDESGNGTSVHSGHFPEIYYYL